MFFCRGGLKKTIIIMCVFYATLAGSLMSKKKC